MSLLQPSSCTCYPLQLPLPPPLSSSEADSPTRRRYTLDCRTGAAVELTRSNIFVHGGLTIPLNLTHVNSVQIQKELILYFAKEKNSGSSFKRLNDWISSETFFLDLISRKWKRVETVQEKEPKNGDETDDEELTPRLKERLYHSMCFANTCLYIFGGLVVSPQSGYELIATNELWELNLQTKKWSLISKDPQITRRFTHSMHSQNEDDDKKDTKLVIVGGLNNIDKPVYQIDIYNVTKGCWETELDPSDAANIISNVDGHKVPMVKETNFSILVENNEAKIPTLALYAAEKEAPSKSGNGDDINPTTQSSIVALPLLPDSQGMRMDSTKNQSNINGNLEVPYNLRFPTGDYFCYTIVTGGFYPNCQTTNFRCFVYDISTGKWTRVGIVCNDGDFNKHRFWKLFVWQSHHQTLLLGTKNDDYNLPTVQKFDYLLSFGLPMISIYSRSLHPPNNQKVILTTTGSEKVQPSSTGSSVSIEANVNNEEGRPFRNPSYASTATSQFERYIRYIAPPLEMTSIRSVFPPYAMVLGKDALEIFGNPISDFEFITDEGDSIGVPLYLLRKRWGCYFDMLLSQGYARACAEYENSGAPSEIIKFSPHASQAVYFSKNSEVSSSGSLETYFNANNQQQQKQQQPQQQPQQQQQKQQQPQQQKQKVYQPKSQEVRSLADFGALPREHPQPHHSNSCASPPYFEADDQDPVSPPSISRTYEESRNRSTRSIQRAGTSSTTSSSGGMVFRVPFQDSTQSAQSDLNLPIPKATAPEEKRRSSSVATAALDYLKPNNFVERWRRASHPNASISSPDDGRRHYSTLRFLPPSSQSSRNPSITSQNSSLSYASSSSDRMGNSLIPQSSNGSFVGSPVLGVLNVALPTQPNIPNEPLPPVPHDVTPTTSGRANSFADFAYSNKSSPLSSRRPSHDTRSSSSDVRRPSEQFQTSLDKQLMDETQTMDASTDLGFLQHRSAFARMNCKSGDSAATSSRLSRISDTNRLSLGSNPDSTESGNSAALEWEPLLTPRTLYMPWPTATVRAFAEFFYTGQVNGKWMLAPVVLNLLIMSKMYEIPLLYTLITEVLYSIIGRKEDSLYVICDSLTEKFHTRLSSYCGDDQELMNKYLAKNETYGELIKLKRSLESIDNGIFDVDLMNKVSRAFSASTNRSSESGTNKFGTSGSMRTLLPIGSTIPTAFAGGPRDSHNSVGSIAFPSALNAQGRQSNSMFTPRVKKKSSLSKEIDTESFADNTTNSESTDSVTNIPSNHNRNDLVDESLIDSYDSNSASSSSSSDTEQEEAELEEDSDMLPDMQADIIDARTEKYDEDEEDQEYNKNMDKLSSGSQKDRSDFDSFSSQSDSDELNSNLGLLSLNKMKRKIAGQADLDESVDPLFKAGPNIQSPTKDYSSQGKPSGGKFSRDDPMSYESNAPTLENLASPNALPPVDYVVKSIYRTAALVNYPRLMVRCMDCIEISKRLTVVKKKLADDFSRMDEDLKQTGGNTQEAIRRQSMEKQKSDSALAKSMSTRPSVVNPDFKGSASAVNTLRRSSAKPAQPQVSPRTSLSKEDEPLQSVKSTSFPPQSRKSIKTKFFGEIQSAANNTAVLMNPAFMPPPPPSAGKGKKNYSGSTGGAFSFFGKKK